MLITEHKKSMSKIEHLPLYAKMYEALKLIYRIIRQFKKEYKFTLGADLQVLSWKVFDGIIFANSLPDSEKLKAIETLSADFDAFKIRFRFAYELKLMGDGKFIEMQHKLEEIGSMIGGWKKWARGAKKSSDGLAKMD